VEGARPDRLARVGTPSAAKAIDQQTAPEPAAVRPTPRWADFVAVASYLALALWVARCARTIFLPGEVNVARIVSGLLAGIVFVDWLAVAPQISHTLSAAIFLPLFGATLWLQRFVPAT